MTATDDRVLEALTDANPAPRETITDAWDDPRAQAMLASIMTRPVPTRSVRRLRSGRARIGWHVLAPVLSLVVVVAVVAVVLHAGSARHSATAPSGATADELVLRLHATPEVPRITAAAVAQEIQIVRARLRYLGTPSVRVTRDGEEIVVHSRQLAASPTVRALLTRDPQIAFTDWEQNVIAPDGRLVATLLLGGNRQAQVLSQGQGQTGLAGGVDSGAVTLYAAVRLASRQPSRAAAQTQTRSGPESFAFAPAGSDRCSMSRTPCWASGPSATPAAASRAARRTGVAHPIVLTVPQGTIVVRASEPGATLRPDYPDTGARFYVMRDDAALTGLDLRQISSGRNAAGQPDVDGVLTRAGARAFQAATAAIAHRGSHLRLGAARNYQHFAIIINGALVTVPIINYDQYPDGVIAASGIQIDGGFSRARATELADTLHLQTLPLRITIARGG